MGCREAAAGNTKPDRKPADGKAYMEFADAAKPFGGSCSQEKALPPT